MEKYRIVIIGSVKFSEIFLNKLILKKKNIVGICTKKINKKKSDLVDLSKLGKKNKIPVIYWNNDEKAYSWIKNKKPDFIFCIGWSKILTEKFLKLPKYFTVGFHPSDIPFNVGRHPIIWSIILNLKYTASTFFIMSKYPDNGFILSKSKIKISKYENAKNLYNKICKSACDQIDNLFINLKKFKHKKNDIKQLKKNIKIGNFLRKRTEDDGLINWKMTAESIDALVRALSKPYDGAHLNYKNRKYKVMKVKIIKKKKVYEPGKIINLENKKPIIQSGKDAIKLIKISPKIYLKKGDYLY